MRTCKHCGKVLQERAFWAHDDDTVFLQAQPLPTEDPSKGGGGTVGRTVWVKGLGWHEPEPAPLPDAPPTMTFEELVAFRQWIAAQKPKQEGERTG